MSLKIYQMAHSPFCIPITQALQSLGQDYETVEIPNWDRSKVMELSEGKYYQVPLLDHKGEIVYESGTGTQDVAHYVESQWGEGRLFPSETEGLQEILIEFIEDQIEDVTFKLVDPPYVDEITDVVDRANVVRHKERRFGAGCVEEWRSQRNELWAEADRLLGRFERTLQHSPYLLGDTPGYVDFALYGIIGNLTYRGYNKLSDNQKSLQDWCRRLEGFRY